MPCRRYTGPSPPAVLWGRTPRRHRPWPRPVIRSGPDQAKRAARADVPSYRPARKRFPTARRGPGPPPSPACAPSSRPVHRRPADRRLGSGWLAITPDCCPPPTRKNARPAAATAAAHSKASQRWQTRHRTAPGSRAGRQQCRASDAQKNRQQASASSQNGSKSAVLAD